MKKLSEKEKGMFVRYLWLLKAEMQWSNEELGKCIGVSRQVVHNWLEGKTFPIYYRQIISDLAHRGFKIDHEYNRKSLRFFSQETDQYIE